MWKRIRLVFDSCLRILGATVILAFVIFMWYRPFPSHRLNNADGHILQGYMRATDCYGGAPVDLQDLEFYVVDRDYIFKFPNKEVVGVTFNHRIFVARTHADDANTWGHEIMHSFGVISHPPALFSRCGFE